MKSKNVLIASAAYNLGESHRMGEIGRALKDMGMNVYSIGKGKYESVLNKYATPIDDIKNEMWYTPERIRKMMNMDVYGNDYCTAEELWDVIQFERELLRDLRPAFVVTGYRTTLSVSCRSVNIPLVWVLSAVVSKLYFEKGMAEMPWRAPVQFVKNISDKTKQSQYYSKLALKNAETSKEWIKIQKKLGVNKFKCDLDIFDGDLNLMSDAQELFPYFTDLPDNYYFCGPLFIKNKIPMPECVRKYVNTGRKKLFISMGSSGEKEIFIKLLRCLKKIDADFFVATTSILDSNDLIEFDNRFFFSESFPHKEIAEWVDMSIIHGGQGTVYMSLLAGKPFIGIPMFSEQQYNLGNLERFGNIIRMSEEELTIENMERNIHKLLYEPKWLDNAKRIRKYIMPYYECDSYKMVAKEILSYGEKASW